MTKWFNVNNIPKDRTILVWGKPEGGHPENLYIFRTNGIHLAHWDYIDEAFCLDGGGWLGPFIKPEAWAEVPEPPKSELILDD